MQEEVIGCWIFNFGKILISNCKSNSMIWIYRRTRQATCWQLCRFRWIGRFASNYTRIDRLGVLTPRTAKLTTVRDRTAPGPDAKVRNHSLHYCCWFPTAVSIYASSNSQSMKACSSASTSPCQHIIPPTRGTVTVVSGCIRLTLSRKLPRRWVVQCIQSPTVWKIPRGPCLHHSFSLLAVSVSSSWCSNPILLSTASASYPHRNAITTRLMICPKHPIGCLTGSKDMPSFEIHDASATIAVWLL